MTEACTSCVEAGDKHGWLRRKRLRLRRRANDMLTRDPRVPRDPRDPRVPRDPHDPRNSRDPRDPRDPRHARDALGPRSLSFCGRLTPEIEDKNERSAASDPATSRKNRLLFLY